MEFDKSSVSYHLIKTGEEATVVDLITKVFTEFVAPHFSREGVSEFLKYIDVDEFSKRIISGNRVLVAKTGQKIIGAIEIRDFSHIALFFVEKISQRKRIGTELLQHAIAQCRARKPASGRFTVNASPNAVSAYQKMGFKSVGDEQVKNGICFVPMELQFDDRTAVGGTHAGGSET